MISIALIEDNRLVREGISNILNQLPDIRVVAASSGAVDISSLRKAQPQVVLLDVGLGQAGSVTLAEQIKKEIPEARIIVMDVLPVHEDIVDFVNVGVAGFMVKDATIDELATTIRSVAQGAHVLPPEMTTTLFAQIARDAVARGRTETLDAVRMTPREQEVINLIATGLGNKEIAARLNIATDTVKSHVRNIMEKLMLHTRLQIAVYAHREGSG